MRRDTLSCTSLFRPYEPSYTPQPDRRIATRLVLEKQREDWNSILLWMIGFFGNGFGFIVFIIMIFIGF